MKQMLRPFILSVLMGIALGAQAQNLIFYQNTQSQAFLFKQGGGGPSAPLVDYFIQRIAQGSNKQVARTEYILVHEDNVRLTKADATHFDVMATLGGFRLTGDTQYRGFSVADILTPGAVKFRLEHRDKAGNFRQGWDFAEVPLGADPTTLASFRATDSSAQFTTDVVVVVDKQFLYTDANRLAFDARTNLVDEYFTISPTLDASYQDLQKIQPTNIDQLDAQDTELRRIQARIETVRAKEFPVKLGLTPQNDPANFLRRFGELDALSREHQARIADTRARMHILLHERGLAHLQGNRPAPARADFQRAIQIAPTFAPAHVELARMSYAEGQGGDAVNRLQYVFNDLQMDEATRQKGVQLGTTIYQNHIGNANYAIQQSDFERALGSLDLAKDLCTRIPAVPCENTLENGYGRAHRGIYLRFVTNGVKAENEKRLDVAEQDGMAALDYQKKFPRYVGEPREAAELLKRVRRARFDGMVAESDRQIKAGNLDAAEKLCRDAIAYQATNAGDIADAVPAKSLLNRVKGLQYTEMIALAGAKAQANDHKAALEGYEKAKAIEKDYEFKQDTTLGARIKVAAKQVLLIDGKRGLEQARSNRLGEARETAATFNRMLDQYALGQDNDLVAVKKDLQDAIFSQECINALDAYNKILATAEQHRAAKKYIEATAAWTQALTHAQQNHACSIDTRAALESKQAHAQVTAYQEKLRKADEALGNVNYGGAISSYVEAGDLFYAQNLEQQFGLIHAPLFDYVNLSGKRDFMAYAANHFCEKKSYDLSLQLVYDLATKGYPKSRLKAIQTRLGKELAIRDKQADAGGDPKLKAAGYTRGSKTMTTLAKAYVKQWKSM